MKDATKTRVKANFCHMSNAVPAVCRMIGVLSIIRSFNVYKGANAIAETISIFTQKWRFFSEETKSCFCRYRNLIEIILLFGKSVLRLWPITNWLFVLM